MQLIAPPWQYSYDNDVNSRMEVAIRFIITAKCILDASAQKFNYLSHSFSLQLLA